MLGRSWEVEFTDEFETWWNSLSEMEQCKVDATYAADGAWAEFGFSIQLASEGIVYPEMLELRAQAGGDPLRILYAFDPWRTAILLVAGDKTGNDR